MLTTDKIDVIILKFEQCSFTYCIAMHPEDANGIIGMANSVDPDQTATSGAV